MLSLQLQHAEQNGILDQHMGICVRIERMQCAGIYTYLLRVDHMHIKSESLPKNSTILSGQSGQLNDQSTKIDHSIDVLNIT